ncbi:GspH/FimT family pseudopilin [Magnetovirga frankeli]|uniref:GspH/FimT family pseudopilin n=1 Tax=Magnetovirga frankeli TaxID=947516 RepID=UPI0012934974|nr:GspH/FimT family pseudopilin [gamma proteobacterium SS-5]
MKQSAFTLIELMVTVAVLGIVSAIAVPSYQTMTRNNRALSQNNSLVAALNYARSEAVKGGRDIKVCPRNTAGTACQADGNWADGWLVLDEANPCVAGGTAPCVLRAFEPLTGSTALTATKTSVSYLARGRALEEVTFTLKPNGCSGTEQRTITVLGMGRVASDKETCS